MLLFLSLISVATSTTLTFSNATITLFTISDGPINSPSILQDYCGKIIARNSSIHHINTVGVYQNWLKGNLLIHNAQENPPAYSIVEDFSVDQMEVSAAIIHYTPITAVTSRTILSFDASYSINGTSNAPQIVFGKKIAKDVLNYYVLTHTVSNAFYATDSLGNINTWMTMNPYRNLALSPDGNKILVWTNLSAVQLIDVSVPSSPILINTWSPQTVPSVLDCTKTISFSHDSSLAIVETDDFNPIEILNTSDLSTVHSITAFESIQSAHFVNSSNFYVIIFGATTTFFVDLNTSSQFPLTYIPGRSYTTDLDNNIFTCDSNVLKQIGLSYSTQTPPASEQSQFYLPLSFQANSQEDAYNIINKALVFTTNATNIISTFASSTPISIYFLSFINYFTLSSLYVLLNFPIPEHIYNYLSLIYQQMSTPILELFGISVSVRPFSGQMVNSKRALHFGVSSDLHSSQTISFLFLIGNISLIFLLNWLLSFLKRKNPLRQIVSQQKWNMVFGHIINVILPLTLPWTFVMLDTGIRNFRTKLNAGCFIILYFLGVFFPIYYFFDLLQERQLQLIQERNQKRREIEEENKKKEKSWTYRKDMWRANHLDVPETKMKNKTEKKKQGQKKKENIKQAKKKKRQQPFERYKTVKITLKTGESKEYKYKKLTFSDLLTFEIVEQWYLCQANFLYPCFVLLSEPIIFLVAIQLYSLLGVIVCFRKREMRTNSTILALYPFVFHVCFMIFYLSTSVQVIILTELVCLGVYLLGLIHHILTLLYEIIAFLAYLYKKCKRKNQIAPKTTKKDKNKNKKNLKKKKKKENEVHIEEIELPQQTNVVVFPATQKKMKKANKQTDANQKKRLKVNLKN